jgi:two-component system sensor histidine kinase/response regulator
MKRSCVGGEIETVHAMRSKGDDFWCSTSISLADRRFISVGGDDKFRALLEAAPDAMVIARSDGRILLVNAQIGIPNEVQSRLFQPFVQADVSTSRRFGGAGLGLAISAQLVEQMGGRIELESAAGKGSKFSFTLLLEKGPDIPRDYAVDALVPRSTIVRGLIVDDSTASRQVVSDYFTAWGIVSRAVSDGAAALRTQAGSRS